MNQNTSKTIPLPVATFNGPTFPAPLTHDGHHGRNPFASQTKLLWHMDRLAEWRLRGDTFPVLMEINLTNYCNEACKWCISAYSHISNPAMTSDEKQHQLKLLDQSSAISNHPERRRGLDIDYLGPFLKRAKAMGLRAVTWSGGGEPTTHPQFMDAVRQAGALGLEQGLMTNGFFKKSYIAELGNSLKWIRVSLDTLDRAKYKEQKVTDALPHVLENIQELAKYSVTVGVNMNLAEWNVDEISSMASWSKHVGADYFQIRPVLGLPFNLARNAPYRTQSKLDWSRIKPILFQAEAQSSNRFKVLVSWDKFDDVSDVEGNFGRTYSKCLYHFFVCVVNANGDLCVCMYHLGDREFSFGNIYEQSLDDIWAGPKRQKVLQMCSGGLDLSTCQVCCKGHEINKLMHFIESPDQETDANFL